MKKFYSSVLFFALFCCNNLFGQATGSLDNSLNETVNDGIKFTLTSNGNCVGSILSIPTAAQTTRINWYRNGTLMQTIKGSGSRCTVAGGNGAGSKLNQLNGPTGVCTDN